MITREGTVTKTEADKTAWVKTMRESACEGCRSKDSCVAKDCGEMSIRVVNTVGAQTGDPVVVGFETASFIKLSFVLYIFPVLALIIGAVIGQKAGAFLNMNQSAASAITGFAFFFLSALIIKLMDRKMTGKKEFSARIIRIKTCG